MCIIVKLAIYYNIIDSTGHILKTITQDCKGHRRLLEDYQSLSRLRA